MKFLIFTILFSFSLLADGTSLLNADIDLPTFGKIKYRAPLNADSKKLPIVLFHGIYGGASNRT